MSDFPDLLEGHTHDFQLSPPFSGPPLSSRERAKNGPYLSLDVPTAFSLDGAWALIQQVRSEAPSILVRPPPPREPSVDWGDVVTWVAEAAALGTGLGLVFGTEERPFHAIGGGLMMSAGLGVLLEVIDRLLRNDHSTRWLRIGISLVAGLLMGLDIQFSPSLDRSGIAGISGDERHPTGGFGP